jgi:hypothetical protein
MADTLNTGALFASGIYSVKLPQYLEAARKASTAALAESPPVPEGMPVPHRMTGNYAAVPELQEFTAYVAQTAWNILQAQGYAMQPLATLVAELWTQEHLRTSDMPQHVHYAGMQMCAFYFLDCPENGCQLAVHDPRPGKCAAKLPEADLTRITEASDAVYFKAEEGLLILTNAWLPHSFTRNMADAPFRFMHINIGVVPAPARQEPEVEVI